MRKETTIGLVMLLTAVLAMAWMVYSQMTVAEAASNAEFRPAINATPDSSSIEMTEQKIHPILGYVDNWCDQQDIEETEHFLPTDKACFVAYQF